MPLQSATRRCLLAFSCTNAAPELLVSACPRLHVMHLSSSPAALRGSLLSPCVHVRRCACRCWARGRGSAERSGTQTHPVRCRSSSPSRASSSRQIPTSMSQARAVSDRNWRCMRSSHAS